MRDKEPLLSAVYVTGQQMLHRNDVIALQSKAVESEIRETVGVINVKLHNARTLPVQLEPSEVGEDTRVKNAVLELIRKAGWTCRAVTDEVDNGPASVLYYIVE